MASKKPSRPNLSLETAPDSQGRQKLIVQEDLAAGQYQIRRLGGIPSASVLSLGHWRPIDRVPIQLLDAQYPPSPESALDSGAVSSQPAHQRGVAKFAAWVKRSGKGLVLRLRRQSNRAVVDFTDVHFDAQELMSADVNELAATHPPLELDNPHWLGTESRNRSRAEGYHHYELPDDHSLVSPTLTELPGSDVQEFDAVEQQYLRSPSDTIATTFSAAETAVDSTVSEIGDDMEVLSLASQPVARNLTVTKSIRYRCASHQDFEPASPNYIVRLTSNPSPRATLRRHVAKRSPSSKQSTIRPLDQVLQVFDAAHGHTNGADSPIGEVVDIPKPTRSEVVVTPASECSPLHAMHGVSMAACVYQQDLHVAKAVVQTQTFTTQLVGLPSVASRDLDSVQALLESFSPLGDLFAPRQGSKADSNLRHLATTAKDPTEKFGELTKVCPRGLAAIDNPLAAKTTLLAERPAQVEADKAVRASIEQSHATHDQQNIISPLSPLDDEDRHRNGSHRSSLVPVTPLTPVHTFKTGGVSHSRMKELSTIQNEGPTEDEADEGSIQQVDSLDDVVAEIGEKEGDIGNTPSSDISNGQNQSNPSETVIQEKKADGQPIEFGVRHLADLVEYQHSPAPLEVPFPPLGFLADDKIPAHYKNTRFKSNLQIDTTVPERSPPQVVFSEASSPETSGYDLAYTGRAQPDGAGALRDVRGMLVSGITTAVVRSALWLQRHAGQEPTVPAGHVRVRWTCACGEKLFDDFRELRTGAASRLEALLNKETPYPYASPASGSRGSQSSLSHTPGSSSHPPSSGTWSNASAGYGPPSGYPFKGTPRSSRASSYQRFPPVPQLFLLTCIYEARNTPKAFNVPLHERPVLTDSQLADALQDRYRKVNAPWYRWLRLRGLTSIDLVQFYMHKNRFADVRKRDTLPEGTLAQEYDFDPPDLLPPIGGHYLLHLFKHPHEYDGERLAYLSVPKKKDVLDRGIGWGIILTEGFLPERIWLLIFFTLVLFGCIFGVVWSVKKDDVQGAFGVASFVTTLASVMVGFAQACQG